MLTREEIAEIVQYSKEHGVSYKSSLTEIGIPEWQFYDSKRRYTEAQASERESGEFQELEAQFKRESIRADFYEEMINIAEAKFNIPIRKKAGTKQ